MRFCWARRQNSLKEAIIIVAKETLKEKNCRNNTNEWV